MDVLQNLIHQTAFFNGTMDWRSYVMILVAFLFLYLAIKKAITSCTDRHGNASGKYLSADYGRRRIVKLFL